MPDATFACPDLTTFCRLDELGLQVTGKRLEADRALLSCRLLAEDRWCRRGGGKAARATRSPDLTWATSLAVA